MEDPSGFMTEMGFDGGGIEETWLSTLTSKIAAVAQFAPGVFVYQDSFQDPDYNSHTGLQMMLGSKGTKVDSNTLWQKGKTERVDVENPSPGKRPGDIHYHEPDNNKWRFDIKNRKFINPKTLDPAPPKIQKLLKNGEIQNAIKKGLKILGETIKLF
jgi:hypothetical protein